MIILNKLTLLLAFIIVIFSFNQCFAQKSKRLELEARRVQIQKEIKNINEMLFDNKKKKAMVFSDIENLTYKILRKEELVKLTNQQINLLDKEIKLNLTHQLELEIQLKEVKIAYGEMILKSYKTKSGKNRLMFLLSSETFFQAFKRMQYMKQYAAFRKTQAIKITSLTNEFKTANEMLIIKKETKEELLIENRTIQKSLESEKKEISTIAVHANKTILGRFNIFWLNICTTFSRKLDLVKAAVEKSHFFKLIREGRKVDDNIHAHKIPKPMDRP